MAVRKYIIVLAAFLALMSCESENNVRQTPEKSKKFTSVITELTLKCENDMEWACNIQCQFVHSNGLREEITRHDGKIYQDTIDITNVKTFPVTLQYFFNAVPVEGIKSPVDVKYSYGMTVSTTYDDFSVIDSDEKSNAYSQRQVEPDSLGYVLGHRLPVTLTASIAQDGTITIK